MLSLTNGPRDVTETRLARKYVEALRTVPPSLDYAERDIIDDSIVVDGQKESGLRIFGQF